MLRIIGSVAAKKNILDWGFALSVNEKWCGILELALRVRRTEMASTPYACPVCGEISGWQRESSYRSGFSVSKALFGAFLFGKKGLLGGFIGNEQVVYTCSKCGWSEEYDK